MSELTLSDIGVTGAVWILGCIVSIVLAVYTTRDFRRQWHNGPALTGRDVLATFGAYFFIGVSTWLAYSGIRGRHLLRVESRYTAATITQVQRFKGQWESHFTYAVGRMRYSNYIGHGSGPALPVGSHWWVRYAAADAAVHEWRYAAVPDSLDVVPADGWPRPPGEPASYVPPVVDDPGAPRTADIVEDDE